MLIGEQIGKPAGYRMPAEWELHASSWLSWPHNTETWPLDGKYQAMIPQYCQLVKAIIHFEPVNINVGNEAMEAKAKSYLAQYGVTDFSRIKFHPFETNDAWCRDHGPIFVKNLTGERAVINWEYNAWGGKYPPFDNDNEIPVKIANYLQLPYYTPGIIMEGGSIEVNGKGTLLTTTSCLLNKNRNPHLSQAQIEQYLMDYLGVNHFLWLGDGIVGDDTDGHIDDITRFVSHDTLLTVVETNSNDENYTLLQENLETLHQLRQPNGQPYKIVELPMPAPLISDDLRLPASYANFLIVNGGVIVPVFSDANDAKALQIIQDCFPDRQVVGVNCEHIVWGLGTVHCLSQQEPA